MRVQSAVQVSFGATEARGAPLRAVAMEAQAIHPVPGPVLNVGGVLMRGADPLVVPQPPVIVRSAAVVSPPVVERAAAPGGLLALQTTLDTLVAATSAETLQAFASQVLDRPGLLPEERHAIEAARAWRMKQLQAAADSPKTFTIGPRSFQSLIELRAKNFHRLPRTPDVLDPIYQALPRALQKWVEERAKVFPLKQAQPIPGSTWAGDWVHDARADWLQNSLNWEHAGVRVVHDTLPTWVAHLGTPAFLGGAFPDHSWADAMARQAGYSQQQIDLARQVENKDVLSSFEAPEFLPEPVPYASLQDLAIGLVARELTTIRNYYEPHFNSLPHEFPSAPPNSSARSLNLLWPKLKTFGTREERRKALPWLLLEYLKAQSPSGLVHLDDLKNKTRLDNEPLEGLFVEAAPDVRKTYNFERNLYRGELLNEALRLAGKYAPSLVPWLSTEPGIERIAAVDRVVNAENDEPLKAVNLIAVQHLLDDNTEVILRLQRLGLSPSRTHVLGVPYSTFESNVNRLRRAGFDVDSSFCRTLPFDIWREVQICALIRKALADHAQNGQPIIAMDDGGHIAAALSKYYPKQGHLFTLVEQTARGITVAAELERNSTLPCDVINEARSENKTLELPGIIRGIRDEVLRRLAPFRGSQFGPQERAVVLGYGWIGTTVAAAMKQLGFSVTVVDPSAEAQAKARHDDPSYWVVSAPDEVIVNASVIAGCSGVESLSQAQLARVRHSPVVFSTSSSSIEFGISLPASLHEDTLVTGPNYSYLMLGSGFPINFTGAGDINHWAEMQYTRAGMVAGIIQAARRAQSTQPKGPPSVIPLEGWRDAQIVRDRALDAAPQSKSAPPDFEV